MKGAGRPAYNQRWGVSLVFMCAVFMTIMDTTIVLVALPSISDSFEDGDALAGLVPTSLLVSLSVVSPTASWVGDRFGPRRTLLFALTVFVVASVACGLAPTLPLLLVFRVIQGSGGGLLVPVAMALMMRTFPAEERVRALALVAIPVACAPAIGPVIGGLLTTALTWRLVFLVNLPIGLVAVILALVMLEERPRPEHIGRFDLLGFVLAGVAFASIVGALSLLPKGSAPPTLVAALFTIGAACLVSLVIVERTHPHPLVNVRIFSNGTYGVASLVSFFSSMSFFGALYLLSMYLQGPLQYSALDAGLLIFPNALGVMIASQIASRVLHRAPPRLVIATALGGLAVTTALLALINETTSAVAIIAGTFALGLCVGHAFIINQTVAFKAFSITRMADATGLYNVQRQLGTASGIAIVSATVSFITATQVDMANAFALAFILSACIAVVAAVAGSFLRPT